jgi:DNA-binding MarR family transcriptional regulator
VLRQLQQSPLGPAPGGADRDVGAAPLAEHGAEPGAGHCAEHCAELVTELSRHARLLHLLKGRAALPGPAGLDGAALGVLMALVKQGPRRQGDLADATFLDPSTVSRYVAQLARAGLVSRRPDPADGRAVQLVATGEGTAVAETAIAHRRAMISDMITDWSADDAATFVRLLRRLNDDMEARRERNEPVGRPIGT